MLVRQRGKRYKWEFLVWYEWISFCKVNLQSNFKGRVRFWWEYMNINLTVVGACHEILKYLGFWKLDRYDEQG